MKASTSEVESHGGVEVSREADDAVDAEGEDRDHDGRPWTLHGVDERESRDARQRRAEDVTLRRAGDPIRAPGVSGVS